MFVVAAAGVGWGCDVEETVAVADGAGRDLRWPAVFVSVVFVGVGALVWFLFAWILVRGHIRIPPGVHMVTGYRQTVILIIIYVTK